MHKEKFEIICIYYKKKTKNAQKYTLRIAARHIHRKHDS